jgi:hypothetical protein
MVGRGRGKEVAEEMGRMGEVREMGERTLSFELANS